MLDSVSVVIPTYNSEKTIRRALDSVLAQTLQPSEIIVVDDGSADATVPALEEYAAQRPDGRIKVVRLAENHGPSYARNLGWDSAGAEFVAFLDADDSWHKRKLELQIGYMAQHPELALTAHRCICVTEEEPPACLPEVWDVKHIVPRRLLYCSYSLLTPSVVVRRDIPYRFDPSKYHAEDRLLVLIMALNGYRVARLELPLGYVYKATYGEGGLSSELWEMQKGELDNYAQLRELKLINGAEENVLKVFSFLKYLRRVWLCRRRSGVT